MIARLDTMPQYEVRKLAWYETASLNMALLMGHVLSFVSVFPVAAIRAVRTRRPSSESPAAHRWGRVAQSMIVGIGAANLQVLGVLAWGATGGLVNQLLDLPPGTKLLLGLGPVSAALTLGALVFAVQAWRDRRWAWPYRLYHSVVTVAAVGFVWFLHYWNMLGWRF